MHLTVWFSWVSPLAGSFDTLDLLFTRIGQRSRGALLLEHRNSMEPLKALAIEWLDWGAEYFRNNPQEFFSRRKISAQACIQSGDYEVAEVVNLSLLTLA